MAKKNLLFPLVILLGLIGSYPFYPAPLKRILVDHIVKGRILAPLSRIWQAQFIDPNKQNATFFQLSMTPELWSEVENDFQNQERRWFSPAQLIDETGSYDVQVKPRDYTAPNYRGVKKSLHISLFNDKTWRGRKGFSVINLKNPAYSNDFFAYEIARTLGVPAPRDELIQMQVNDYSLGLYHLIEDFDSLYFNSLGIPPSNVFSLDFYGKIQDEFFDSSHWQEIQNMEVSHQGKLQELLNCLKTPCQNINELINVELFLMNKIIFELFGSDHLDYYHNHKIFLAENGKFNPINWDISQYFKSHFEDNQSYEPITRSLLTNPKWRLLKLKLQNRIFKEIITEDFIRNYFKNFLEKYEEDFKADRYMGSWYSISNEDWVTSLENNVINLIKRRKELLGQTQTPPQISLKKLGPESFELRIEGPLPLYLVKVEAKGDILWEINNETAQVEEGELLSAHWTFAAQNKEEYLTNSKIKKAPGIFKLLLKGQTKLHYLEFEDPLSSNRIKITPKL